MQVVIFMDFIYNDLQCLIEEHGGLVSGKNLQDFGIERFKIYDLCLKGILLKESHGNYMLADNKPDEYAIIQNRSDKLIFSHATALFLHGISDRIPNVLDITIPQGDNVSRIKKDYQQTRFYYCKKDLWDIGIDNVKTPQGYNVKAYDIERCICDLIRCKKSVDQQIYIQAIKEYFSGKKCNPRKIIKYARKFNIEDKVRIYMEVLQR